MGRTTRRTMQQSERAPSAATLRVVDPSRTSPRARLAVQWFDAWAPELDAALARLPEMDVCPHELFRMLARSASSSRKRTALVTEAGRPVAVIALRRRQHHWEPVGEMTVPYACAPALPGRLIDALRALDAYVVVPDWRGGLPASPYVRDRQVFAAYRINTDADFDAVWRLLRNHDRVRKARSRCGRLGRVDLEVDHPDAAAWTIEHWRRSWAARYPEVAGLAGDIQLAAKYLTGAGRYRAFRLLIDGQPVAGTTWSVNGDTLAAHSSYYDRRYAAAGVGVRLDDLMFRWSTGSPYRTLDLGGEFAFKAKWAPVAALHANFSVIPTRLLVVRSAVRTACRMARIIPFHASAADAPVDSER